MRLSIGSFLLITLFSHPTFAQTLVLMNGETIKGRAINYKKETVRISVDGKELFYRRHEVDGYFENEGPMQYLKLIPGDDQEKQEYDFFERIVDGEIKAYKRTITSVNVTGARGGTTYNSSISLLGEKGNQSGWLVQNQSLNSPAFSDGDADKELLKGMISDQREFVDRINSGKLKYRYDEIVEFLSEYNVAAFEKSVEKNASLSYVQLYRMPRKKYFPIQVTVDDSAQYDMPIKRALSIPLQPNALHKLCLSSDTVKTCMVIRRIPYFNQYFAIDLKEGWDELKIKTSNEKEATYYITRSLTY